VEMLRCPYTSKNVQSMCEDKLIKQILKNVLLSGRSLALHDTP